MLGGDTEPSWQGGRVYRTPSWPSCCVMANSSLVRAANSRPLVAAGDTHARVSRLAWWHNKNNQPLQSAARSQWPWGTQARQAASA
jgi:hypothetical protein